MGEKSSMVRGKSGANWEHGADEQQLSHLKKGIKTKKKFSKRNTNLYEAKEEQELEAREEHLEKELQHTESKTMKKFLKNSIEKIKKFLKSFTK